MSKETLKEKFETGDKSTGEDFAELIESIPTDEDIDNLVEKSIRGLPNEIESSRGDHESLSNRLDAIDEDLSKANKEIESPLSVTLTNYENAFKWGVDNTGKKYNLVRSVDNDIILKGQTLVNLNPSSTYYFATHSANAGRYEETRGLNKVTVTISEDLESWRYLVAGTINVNQLKPNTKYTICFKKCKGLSGVRLGSGDSTEILTDTVGISNSKALITTKSTLNSTLPIFIFCTLSGTAGQVVEIEEAVLLEGDHRDKSIEFFEGLKSAGQANENIIKIRSTGENLVDDMGVEYDSSGGREYIRTIDFAPVFDKFGRREYTLSFDLKTSGNTGNVRVYMQNGSGAKYSFAYDVSATNEYRRYSRTITPSLSDNGLKESYLSFYGTYGSGVFPIIKNIKLSFGSNINGDFTPYISNETEIVLDQPLRSLPNGVTDSVELKEGRAIVTRRCGEVLLETFSNSHLVADNGTEELVQFNLTITMNKKSKDNALCSNFNIDSKVGNPQYDKEGVTLVHGKENSVVLRIRKDKLSSLDATGLRSWLSQNKVTVSYELLEPVVEEFYLKEIERHKDGHIIIETGTIPLSETTHKVALNMKEQISSAVTNVKVNKRLLVDILARLEAGGL